MSFDGEDHGLRLNVRFTARHNALSKVAFGGNRSRSSIARLAVAQRGITGHSAIMAQPYGSRLRAQFQAFHTYAVIMDAPGVAFRGLFVRLNCGAMEMDIWPAVFLLCAIFIFGGIGIVILATILSRIGRESWW